MILLNEIMIKQWINIVIWSMTINETFGKQCKNVIGKMKDKNFKIVPSWPKPWSRCPSTKSNPIGLILSLFGKISW